MANTEEQGKAMGGCVLALLALTLGIVANAFALMLLWRWFVVDVFGVTLMLTFAQSLGAVVLLAFLTARKPDVPDEREFVTKATESFGYALVKPAYFIAVGWLVYVIIR